MLNVLRCKTESVGTSQDMQCTYNLILRRVHVTIAAVEKAVSVTYSECASVALVIQHSKRMRHIVSSVARPALPYFFPRYLINGSQRFSEEKKSYCI